MGGNPRPAQGIQTLPAQGVEHGHRREGVRRLHGNIAHLEAGVPGFLQAAGGVLRRQRPGAGLLGLRPRNGHGAFPVAEPQGQGLAGERRQTHVHSNGRFGHGRRLRHLPCVGQAADQHAGPHPHIRAQAQKRLLPRGDFLARINHVLVRGALRSQLQAVPVMEGQQGRKPGEAALHPFNFAQGHAQVIHPLRVNHRRVLRAHGVAAHEISPVEHLPKGQAFVRPRLGKMSILQAVDGLSVAGRGHRHVLGALEPALQLHRRNPRLGQGGQVVPETHVPRAEPGGGFPPVGIGQAAGLGAAPTVAAALP